MKVTRVLSAAVFVVLCMQCTPSVIILPGADAGMGGGSSGTVGGGSAGGTASTGGGSATGGGLATGGGVAATPGYVYANSNHELYRFDATGGSITHVGPFDCIGTVDGNATDGMRDLAIDSNDHIIGLGTNYVAGMPPTLFNIDPDTGHCTKITELNTGDGGIDIVAGISFVPVGTLSNTEEVLVGSTYACDYVRVSMTTGLVQVLGNIAPNCFSKSADVVSIEGDATYTVVRIGNSTDDSLLVLNPVTGALISNRGGVGQEGVGGLAFFGNRLYGFGVTGDVFGINRMTGQATLVLNLPGVRFTGAAVATDTPVIN